MLLNSSNPTVPKPYAVEIVAGMDIEGLKITLATRRKTTPAAHRQQRAQRSTGVSSSGHPRPTPAHGMVHLRHSLRAQLPTAPTAPTALPTPPTPPPPVPREQPRVPPQARCGRAWRITYARAGSLGEHSHTHTHTHTHTYTYESWHARFSWPRINPLENSVVCTFTYVNRFCMLDVSEAVRGNTNPAKAAKAGRVTRMPPVEPAAAGP
jgi:hypothetical protein